MKTAGLFPVRVTGGGTAATGGGDRTGADRGDHLAAVYRYAVGAGAIEQLDVVAAALGIAMRQMNEAVAQLVESRLLRAEDAGRRFVPVDPSIAAAMLVSSVEREIYQRRELIDLIRERIDVVEMPPAGPANGNGPNGGTSGAANGAADGAANGAGNGANGTVNGKVNGTVNGAVTGHPNGHANGAPNGHANGAPNGHANGATNGHANGVTNGHVNGHQNGHANGHAGLPSSVDYLVESMEVRGLLKVAGDACREEVLVLQSTMDDAEAFEEASRVYLPLLARGIQVRVICQHRSRADFSARMRMKKWTEAGASVRTVPHVPRAAAVFDRSLAVIFGLAGDAGVARVHNRGVVQFLLDLFNHLWDAATPLEGAESGYANVADDLQQAIAGLMAKGYTDEVVARKLGMSVRTCRRHIAAMMRDLDAISRFQAGVQAARRSLVNGS